MVAIPRAHAVATVPARAIVEAAGEGDDVLDYESVQGDDVGLISSRTVHAVDIEMV